MIVCIAEKPSVARDIARIIGATTSHDGYMEGNGFQVTWTFGHLCTLKEPHDYTPMGKSWSLTSLPMIPERFGIKLINYLFATKFLNLAIKAEYVKQVKLPITSEKQKVQIEELVNAILQGKLSDADTSKEESEIDLLVYHLYGLTYDEVLIVDPETPIIREEYEKILCHE